MVKKRYLDSYITALTFIFCFLFGIAGSVISVVRYRQFEVFYYDFGIFDTAIWKVAHFSPPIIDHFLVGGKWIFADHFNPSIFLLSPLYWFTNNPEIILIAQAVIVAISGFVLYKIGQHILRNNFLSFAVVVSYFLFVGVQNAIITDFHEVTLAVLPFMLCVYALFTNRRSLFVVSVLILLGCKESNFLIGVGVGILAIFLKKRWLGLTTILLSTLWGFITIHLLIPAFSGSTYLYTEPISLNFRLVSSLFDNPVKQHTLFVSYLSFGFLPLLSPAFWFLQFQDFFTRMYSQTETRWGFGFHYSVLSGAILSASSLVGLRFLLNKLKYTYLPFLFACMLIANAIFLYRFVLRGPFGLVYNTAFYQHTKDFSFLNTMIKKIPPTATVAAPNNLASHFTHQQIWLLRSNHAKGTYDSFEKNKPGFILIDTRSGQNLNDFYGIDDIPFMLDSLLHDPFYHLYYHTGNQYIFKRN